MPKYLDSNGLLYFWQKIKAKFLTSVDYDATNKKLTKTLGGNKSDIVSVSTIKTDLNFTKGDIGLGNVDNTSDADKPISTATQTALNGKAASDHVHGNITNAGALQTTDIAAANGDKLVVTDASNSNKVARTSIAFDGSTTTKCLTQKGTWVAFNNYTHPSYDAATAAAIKVGRDATGHVLLGDALAKGDVGLGNVDNTSDANKPISTATQTALNAKAASDHVHGDINNDGTISASAVTVASSDAIVIVDNTNKKVVKSSIAFGSSTTKCLTQKGTWADFNKYTHPTSTAADPAAVKIGRDATGHVLIGDALVASDVGAIASSSIGAANGVCPLNANSLIDSQYLPSFVDDIVEAYARSGQTALSSTWLATESATGTVITPQTGVIYVLMADSGDYTANSQFRWSGTSYVKLNDGGVSAITNAEIDAILAA